jgi:hypothetical protein
MKRMRVLFILTPWRQAHRWELNEDGLVLYQDEWVTPREVAGRFVEDFPMFNVIKAEVCERIDNEEGDRPFRWVDLERFI